MIAGLDNRKVLALVVVAVFVMLLGLKLVMAVAPSAYNDRFSSCDALKPTEANAVYSSGFPVEALDLEFPGQDINGNTARLSAYRGQVVFLNFWAPWCAPCIEEMPAMEALSRTFSRRPFTMLAVASEKDRDKIAQFFADPNVYRGGTTMTILLDPPTDDEEVGPMTRRYGTQKLPETYLIDKNGVIRYYFVNQRDWNSVNARRCVQALLDE